MLASGVDQATVMKIGGWQDLKTFQIYVRLAGIEVKGATDVLRVFSPSKYNKKEGNVINFMR
jgi:integrase